MGFLLPFRSVTFNIWLMLLLFLWRTVCQSMGDDVRGQAVGRKHDMRVWNRNLLTNLGDVLAPFHLPNNSGIPDVFAVSESTIFYLLQDMKFNTLHTVNKLELDNSSMQYTVSQLFQTPYGGLLHGLAPLDDNHFLVTDRTNDCIWKLGVASNQTTTFLNVTQPSRAVRHPLQPYVFVATNWDRILKVSSEFPSSAHMTTITGPPRSQRVEGLLDSSDAAEAQFSFPLISARSISGDGSSLFIGDRRNGTVRRMCTTSGNMETIADRDRLRLDKDDLVQSPVVTSDGLNLFVASENTSWFVIHWLVLPREDLGKAPRDLGKAARAEKIVEFHTRGTLGAWSLTLSKDDRYMFLGTSANELFKFRMNLPTPLPPSPAHQPDASWTSSYLAKGSWFAVRILLAAVCVILVCRIVGIMRNHCGPETIHHGTGVMEEKWAISGHNVGVIAPFHRRYSGESSEIMSSDVPVSWLENDGKSLLQHEADRDFYLCDEEDGQTQVNPEHGVSNRIREFSLQELQEATNDFHDTYLLKGKGGGYGEVYRAHLTLEEITQPTEVAIKVMRGGFNALKHKQFMAELSTLKCVWHKNLCKLLGYCQSENRCILVYPFIKGGSLHDRLHCRCPQRPPQADCSYDHAAAVLTASFPALDWKERVLIAKQVATALNYLHHEVEPHIVHRDVKSPNVLIEGSGNKIRAYLSDFGLAKPGKETHFPAAEATDGPIRTGEQTVLTITRSGTPGYMAPEYIYSVKLTAKNDVFAFGVVLLELVTGQKAIIHLGEEEGAEGEGSTNMPLYLWARQWLPQMDLISQMSQDFVDMTIRSSVLTIEELAVVWKLAQLGRWCTEDLPSNRPSMREALHEIIVMWQQLSSHAELASPV